MRTYAKERRWSMDGVGGVVRGLVLAGAMWATAIAAIYLGIR